MGSIVRLVALEITNIKNVRNGRIVMPNASQKQLSYKKAEVLGLYGQNGSGKTAVIDALDILQRVMIGFTLKDEIAGYIGVDCRQSGIEADFNIFSEKAIYEVHYEVWLQKNEKGVDKLRRMRYTELTTEESRNIFHQTQLCIVSCNY